MKNLHQIIFFSGIAFPCFSQTSTHTIGKTSYEVNDHLGNVVATISDVANYNAVSGTTKAMLESCNNYYAFGMEMPGRNYSSPNYRYGYNGKEKDDELKGSANSLDFGARIYDPRLGQWLSVDPLQEKYPALSPYNYVAGNPINFIDPDGREIKIPEMRCGYDVKVVRAGFDIVYAHLRIHGASDVLDELDKKEYTTRILETNGAPTYNQNTGLTRHSIHWNILGAKVTLQGQRLSPAVTLVAAAAQFLYEGDNQKINAAVTSAAAKLGEISATQEIQGDLLVSEIDGGPGNYLSVAPTKTENFYTGNGCDFAPEGMSTMCGGRPNKDRLAGIPNSENGAGQFGCPGGTNQRELMLPVTKKTEALMKGTYNFEHLDSEKRGRALMQTIDPHAASEMKRAAAYRRMTKKEKLYSAPPTIQLLNNTSFDDIWAEK